MQLWKSEADSLTQRFQDRWRSVCSSLIYHKLPLHLLSLLGVKAGRPGAAHEPGQPCLEQISAGWSRYGKQLLG